ncbi:MAG: hypothetical protein HFH41_09035 [Lachnospiraceae bacterium]|nr:hypothetical protein [Lachnospiraceae bacterium]
MKDIVKGSISVLNSFQITSDIQGMDAASKEILKNKEVLAVILKGVVAEYRTYTLQEIMDFIEADSITSEDDVTTGRTNTRIQGENIEFVQLNEKTSNFDLRFTSRNPLQSGEVQINLHIDLEPQKNYRPGYPIEKRGIYYLARSLGSQLSVATERTDYSSLEKCYSIWICRDHIPKEEQYSISYYEMQNVQNSGECRPRKEDYDLLSLVIIRLGSPECPKKDDLLEFLSAIFYPHKKDFLDTVQKYIDFSHNEELKKEVSYMDGLGMSILEQGIERGIEQGIERGIEQGIEEGLERGRAVQIVASVNNLMESLHLTLQDACKALGLQQKDYEKARDMTR